MTWFETLTGFAETTPEAVRAQLTLDGPKLQSAVNGRTYTWGRLEIASLAALRRQLATYELPQGRLQLRELVADVQQLHTDPQNAGALFQAASQFNLLEMVGPGVTPEEGVGIYDYDRTQGPACAIAAGAGTIYRNYFVPLAGQTGQSADQQIDCLQALGAALGNEDGWLWQMKNGYALPSRSGLDHLATKLAAMDEREWDALRQLLQIGLQWDTQVTLAGCEHLVNQAYCSALPVAYSTLPADLWEDFACLILEATYEATLCAAAINLARTGNARVYLTLVGGGAFGNANAWIFDALRRTLGLFAGLPLDVSIVSYGRSQLPVFTFVDSWNAETFQ